MVIVHGGAGRWPVSLHKIALGGVLNAANVGYDVLRDKGSALDAVVASVSVLEDNPTFNAGTGSTLNLVGDVEADAGIMDGESLRGGGVALLRRIRNPIRAARLVMDKTHHVLIAGRPAEKIAIANGLTRANLKIPSRVKAWKTGIRQLDLVRTKKRSGEILRLFAGELSDTVGALALDYQGNLAAGDSTGGVSLKIPGRIGDSPILGAGLYADNRSGAATATGLGEQAIRLAISKAATDLMTRKTAPGAAVETIRLATERVGTGTGIITLDKHGRYGVAHNTRNLCWAARTVTRSTARMSGVRVSRK